MEADFASATMSQLTKERFVLRASNVLEQAWIVLQDFDLYKNVDGKRRDIGNGEL